MQPDYHVKEATEQFSVLHPPPSTSTAALLSADIPPPHPFFCTVAFVLDRGCSASFSGLIRIDCASQSLWSPRSTQGSVLLS